MATIRKRGDKWQVQVRRQGYPPMSKSFINKRDGEAWAREMERKIERGEAVEPRTPSVAMTVGDLLDRYLSEVTPSKRSAEVETYRIGMIKRHPLARLRVVDVTPADVATYRDARLETVSGETVRQDLVLLRQAFKLAIDEWGIRLAANPLDAVRKPKPAQARTRRVSEADIAALDACLRKLRNPLVKEIIAFALATGMRRGEILAAEWRFFDPERRVLLLPRTKNGHPRTVPLSPAALVAVERVKALGLTDDKIFPMSPNAFKLAWQRLARAAKVQDLRFHDFRHEAVSRFFEGGLSLPEVALISGHRDPRQLLRYTHLDAIRVAAKL